MDSSLRMAKVVKVHPRAHAVDLIYLDDLSQVPMVQVMGPMATTNTGMIDMPEPTAPAKVGDVAPTKDRDMYAVVGRVGRTPVVVGFLQPQVSQMAFEAPNLRLNRHASDVYSSLDDGGNFEMHWPNGTYLRVAEDPNHADLEGKDFDAKFKLKRNTAKALHVRLVVKNAGAQTVALSIAPTGEVTLVAKDLTATLTGNLGLAVTGNITSSAAAWGHTGPLNVTGDVGVTGTVTASVDVVGGGKSLKTHTHGGVQTGAGTTGPPV